MSNIRTASLPLMREVRACRVCEQALPFEPRPLAVASALSMIVIIGQAPGYVAHNTGKSWNDASGKRLRAWLGVDEAQFYDVSLIALMPMGFCYPGKSKNGDMPPRAECAPLWHPRILRKLSRVEFTIYVGSYAYARYLADQAATLTECVRAAERLLPKRILLPHPSPRNQIWLKRNPWFATEVVPALQKRVRQVLRESATPRSGASQKSRQR